METGPRRFPPDLKEKRAQQLLRSDRWTTAAGVKLPEVPVELEEHFAADHLSDGTEGVIRRDPPLRSDVTEDVDLVPVVTALSTRQPPGCHQPSG